MNALETLQARVLLARYYTVERDATATGWFADGQVPRLLPAGLRPGGFLSRDWAPNDAAEWLTGELMLRCIVVWGLRGMYDSVYAGRPQAHDILAFPLPAPCSDVVFSLPALEAFERVRTPGGGPIRRPLLDPRPLRELSPPLDAGAALVRAAVAPIFEMRAGRLSLLLLVQYLCALFVRLRDHAAAHGVDPVALASSPPELDTPPGAAFRNGCRILDFLLAQIYDQLPADIGPALLAGDPGPFFARSAAIGGPPGAHAMLPYFIALRALPIAAWVRGDPASAGAAFFASAPLASALESGIVAADLMRAQLRLDPELRCSGAFAFMPAMKIGALGAAVAAVAGGDAAAQGAEDARAAAAYLRALVVNAPTGRPQLDAFNGMLGRLGIAAPGGSPAQGEEGKAEAGTFVAALGVADLLSAELFGLRIGDDAAEGES
ncbi:hypothetical protein DFJ74DRAFT_693088 [Hyaloraphidium curvatum]|nr:hypothetical protein DFJ74DRAFT_693088 [Hyaloraphidium curvatum]